MGRDAGSTAGRGGEGAVFRDGFFVLDGQLLAFIPRPRAVQRPLAAFQPGLAGCEGGPLAADRLI